MVWIAIIAVVVLVVLWGVGAQRKLVALDENINNAMSQIGVQLSSRWDALTALLDLTKGYEEHEYKTLMDTVAQRKQITASSTAEDAQAQDNLITQTLGRIMAVAENYPDLKANENYITTMNSVNSYEGMVRQSRMIYNDCVTKLNRATRQFPTSLVAGIFGFSQRAYLEAESDKTDMPSMK